jgi:hypothetical protein
MELPGGIVSLTSRVTLEDASVLIPVQRVTVEAGTGDAAACSGVK